jgi:hypothetical protein
MPTERQLVETELRKLEASITAKQEELRVAQSGWCEDTFVTGGMRRDLGNLKQQWTQLSQTLRRLATIDETSSRGSSSFFHGSSF